MASPFAITLYWFPQTQTYKVRMSIIFSRCSDLAPNRIDCTASVCHRLPIALITTVIPHSIKPVLLQFLELFLSVCP